MFSARYSSGSSGSAPSAPALIEFSVLGLEGVGNVFEEDQAEDDVLVFRRVHIVAQRVGGRPELRFEAVKSRIGRRVCRSSHDFHLAGMVADRDAVWRLPENLLLGCKGAAYSRKRSRAKSWRCYGRLVKREWFPVPFRENICPILAKVGRRTSDRCPCRDCSSAPTCCSWQVFFSLPPHG